MSDLAGIKISLKEDSSRALLEHKYIKPEDKSSTCLLKPPAYLNSKLKNGERYCESGHIATKETQPKPAGHGLDTKTETFLKLIERNETSWKDLKEKDLGDVLMSRDQTFLRDKARNKNWIA